MAILCFWPPENDLILAVILDQGKRFSRNRIPVSNCIKIPLVEHDASGVDNIKELLKVIVGHCKPEYIQVEGGHSTESQIGYLHFESSPLWYVDR